MQAGRRICAHVLVLGWAMLGATSVLADSFRCGTYIIGEGMAGDEVREKCGAPDLVRIREEPVRSRLANGATTQVGVTTTEFWFYGRRPSEFVVQVAVRDSIAVEIELLSIRTIEELPPESP